MKYFLDTEFIEGFHKSGFGRIRHHIDLVSIGIVCEDGREYHAISSDYKHKDANDWVKNNVLLPLYKTTVNGDQRNRFGVNNFHNYYGVSHKRLAADITLFCNPVSEKEFTQHEFYGYFSDYDWVVFCSLFGTMMDLPNGFPMYCRDLKQMMDDRGLSKEWKQENCPDPEGEHNALVDAKWNKKLYNAIINNQNQ